MDWRFLVSLVFAVIIAFFAIANSTDVNVNFIFAEYELSQAVVILISAMFGALVVTFLGVVRQVKSNLRIRTLGKDVDRLENEKTQLSNTIIELQTKLSSFTQDNESENPEDIEKTEVLQAKEKKQIKETVD